MSPVSCCVISWNKARSSQNFQVHSENYLVKKGPLCTEGIYCTLPYSYMIMAISCNRRQTSVVGLAFLKSLSYELLVSRKTALPLALVLAENRKFS